jgi:hypothetical protein
MKRPAAAPRPIVMKRLAAKHRRDVGPTHRGLSRDLSEPIDNMPPRTVETVFTPTSSKQRAVAPSVREESRQQLVSLLVSPICADLCFGVCWVSTLTLSSDMDVKLFVATPLVYDTVSTVADVYNVVVDMWEDCDVEVHRPTRSLDTIGHTTFVNPARWYVGDLCKVER